jgi:hypothetical protein
MGKSGFEGGLTLIEDGVEVLGEELVRESAVGFEDVPEEGFLKEVAIEDLSRVRDEILIEVDRI